MQQSEPRTGKLQQSTLQTAGLLLLLPLPAVVCSSDARLGWTVTNRGSSGSSSKPRSPTSRGPALLGALRRRWFAVVLVEVKSVNQSVPECQCLGNSPLSVLHETSPNTSTPAEGVAGSHQNQSDRPRIPKCIVCTAAAIKVQTRSNGQ